MMRIKWYITLHSIVQVAPLQCEAVKLLGRDLTEALDVLQGMCVINYQRCSDSLKYIKMRFSD